MKLTRKFAVVRLWPDQATAEHENIQRIKLAAQSIGYEMVQIDRNGYYVEEPKKELAYGDVDLVIHLHYETPKVYDSHSYVTLWNPLKFYHEWGYERYTGHLMSHDDFISCGSESADDHIKRLLIKHGKEPLLNNFIQINHTLATPIFKPNLEDPRIFYCGINWERLGRGKGRHDDYLKTLDKMKILRIYGPDRIQGIKVWEGYQCYVKPIPFDGKTLVKEISKCGISLVFSSDAHVQSDLMSNRLFESIAGGAIIICDDNEFAYNNFGDSLLYVEHSEDPERKTEQIIKHYNWILENKQKALEMAQRAQSIFLEKFSLDNQLRELFEENRKRIEIKREKYFATNELSKVNVVLPLYDVDTIELDQILLNLKTQVYSNIELHVVIDRGISKSAEIEKLLTNLKENKILYQIHTLDLFKRDKRIPLGKLLVSIRGYIQDSYFMFMNSKERWFHDHISTLVRAISAEDENIISTSDYLIKHYDSEGKEFRDYFVSEKSNPLNFSILGKCLINGVILNDDNDIYFKYLDGMYLLACMSNLADIGKVQYTKQVTCIFDISKPVSTECYIEPYLQKEILRESIGEEVSNSIVEEELSFRQIYEKLNQLQDTEKARISVFVLKNLPLPRKLLKTMRWVYRKFLKKGE